MRTRQTRVFWRLAPAWIVLTVSLAACGSGQPSAHSQAKPAVPVVPAPPASTATAAPSPATPITFAAFSRTVDASGRPTASTQVFHASVDRRVFLALQMPPLSNGSRVSYLRTESGRYVDSDSVTLQPKAAWVDFQWTSMPGTTLSRGSYVIRVYVNDVRAWEGAFEVL